MSPSPWSRVMRSMNLPMSGPVLMAIPFSFFPLNARSDPRGVSAISSALRQAGLHSDSHREFADTGVEPPCRLQLPLPTSARLPHSPRCGSFPFLHLWFWRTFGVLILTHQLQTLSSMTRGRHPGGIFKNPPELTPPSPSRLETNLQKRRCANLSTVFRRYQPHRPPSTGPESLAKDEKERKNKERGTAPGFEKSPAEN